MSPFMQGLGLSVLGISITFATLALLVGVMKLLQYLFSPQPAEPTAPQEPPAVAVNLPAAVDIDEDQRVVAAIAAAVTHLRALGLARSGLGQSFKTDPGGWWVTGQTNQLNSGVVQRMEGK